MERYYKILGIPSTASKEEIKKAYHTKLKALHPDKVHSAIFKDTATYLTAEINEAYNYLTSHANETQQHTCQWERPEYPEENIFIEGYGTLKYTLSDDFEEIKNAILRQTGKDNINFTNGLIWYANPQLSVNVKKAMNRKNLNYSMTIYTEDGSRITAINKRINNEWYSAIFDEELELSE